MPFKLRIITPRGDYFKGDIDLLNVKTENGYVSILPNHFPLITMLDIAPMYFKQSGATEHFAISSGVLNVKKREVIILTNAIESQQEIDMERAQSAKNRAETRLDNKENNNIDIKRAELALQRAITRINVKTSE